MSKRITSPDFDRALILQGDWEAGLCNVAKDLMDAGKEVTKVILHAGDWIYKLRGVPCIEFDESIAVFENWLRTRIEQGKIDCMILYNQYRPYNQIGWDLAREYEIECIVFELGLLRPDYCTIYSQKLDHFNYLSERWQNLPADYQPSVPDSAPARLARMSTPCKMVQFGLYFIFSRLMSVWFRKYRHYVDQRRMGFGYHFAALIRGGLRFQGREKQQRFDRVFAKRWSGKYYIVPLQVQTDSQISKRSTYKNIEEFIWQVSKSFIENAPSNTRLIFKVHPMDRGYEDYRHFIGSIKSKFDTRRIHYLDRVHLPTVLSHARGCVTVNSSVGLSALIHHTPVITLGTAAYDLDALCFHGNLDEFWTSHGDVDRKAVARFVSLLKETSQAYGTLFQRIYATYGRSKIIWPADFNVLFESTKTGEITTKPQVRPRGNAPVMEPISTPNSLALK